MPLNISSNFAIYLRKSRLDLDAEARGEGDTLARHEKTLVALARSLKLSLSEIYREVRSGDSISERPEMQRLLDDVRRGTWAGVLVMDIDRLARGDTIDQGRVAQVFKYSETKIITPLKTYDPSDEYDEEFFEFSLFMARREYKMITRRMQRGRIASAEDGNYIAGHAPYGYKRTRDDKGPTLQIEPSEAEIVKKIYDMYTKGGISTYSIAKKLNEQHIPSKKGAGWSQESVRDILHNPTYIGKIRWRNRISTKDPITNKKSRRYANDKEYILSDGRHESIISNEQFRAAEEIMAKKYNWPVKDRSSISNPFAHILRCSVCGKAMIRVRRGNGTYGLACKQAGCTNHSAPLLTVENIVLDSLKKWLENYTIVPADPYVNTILPNVEKIESDLTALTKQRDNLYDLLEQGVYSKELFIERSRVLAEKIVSTEADLVKAKNEIAKEDLRIKEYKKIIPSVEGVLNQYPAAKSAEEKNRLLRSVVDHILFTRVTSTGDITINLFPKLP